jgi:hypothetical protein
MITNSVLDSKLSENYVVVNGVLRFVVFPYAVLALFWVLLNSLESVLSFLSSCFSFVQTALLWPHY